MYKLQMPPEGTQWQETVGDALRVAMGVLILMAGVSLVAWEVFHHHDHRGHQWIAGGLIFSGLWLLFEEALLRALEAVAALLPWTRTTPRLPKS
jgi:hypothetical protein